MDRCTKRFPPVVLISVHAILILAVIAGNPFLDATQEIPCCSLVTGSCKTVCSKISLVVLGAEAEARENSTKQLLQFCSVELSRFWACVNATLTAVRKNENWTGRGCCQSARNPVCRTSCALAGSRADLTVTCRPSDELELYSCLERREEADRCCSTVTNDTCRSICRDLFHKPARQSSLKLYSSKGCFHQVPRCLKAVTEVKRAEDPKQHLHCCDEATTPACLETCKWILHTATTEEEIVDTLVEKCSPILPQSPMWGCLLKSGSAKPPRLPLDAGKLSCCTKAVSLSCQNLCWRAFQADWEYAWSQLDTVCLTSSQEDELRRCLEDADDPCEMGCSGLNYCARYNDRPTTLFRTCSAAADDAAKWEADLWSRGGVIRGLGVPVRAAASCPPETLRAAACLLQLRPCESRVHETRLCREDCLELMASCVDWSSVTGPHTAATLCMKLSPGRADAACVSLRPFLEDPQENNEPVVHPDEDITTPCKVNDCPAGQICLLTPNGAKTHRCVPGCTLGEMSRQAVPLGSWIQIPKFDEQGCQRICQCTRLGLEKCRTLNCYSFKNCWVHDRFIGHKASFYLECNPCHCFEGEFTCSKRSCGEARPPSLPCDCPGHYVPVCGRLGFTFASGCLAKCAEMTTNEVEFGSCSTRDPCASNPCDSSETCVRRTRVCLSRLHKPCPQFQCVPNHCDPRDHSGPVCDKHNRQHGSVCSMIRAGAELGYWGPCLKGCSLRGPVCGINGEVYANECAAWAERTVVDYQGPCVAVGLIGEEAKPRCSDSVRCPELAEPYCLGVTPPGACCPVCAGAAKLFYSKKQVDKIYYVMEEDGDKDAVTLDALLAALGRQVQVAQCSVRGMITPDRDVFVLVEPISRTPSTLQLRACVSEAEKLVTRITERSPRIAAEVPLSALTRAEIAHTYVSGAITIIYGQPATVLLSLAIYSLFP